MLKETGIKRIIQYVINVRYALENSGRLSAKNIKIQDINTVNNWPLSIKNFFINYDCLFVFFKLIKVLNIVWKKLTNEYFNYSNSYNIY